ncbi:S-adenosyl-methyltransferase [Galdieria sulphuraria]|uniref:S-adenosyl-methyltransferase n=1 Tax=Galdieria sulphuraria TaxID=130081 RepID=M2W5W1_GALSU|nr:S-adenosyl-methyltransferase [Galdieria sulphuraria]EME31161.1 S-adenosyl-methyltransferase [Galdieria sulphuraria]|eukprot:XP_005707681.1 S-adenosyl-methyltransferase [Galdieria sulphuraria]
MLLFSGGQSISNLAVFSRQGRERNLHVPVLLQEVIENAVQANVAGKVFVDCTVGAGGHCQKIMELGIFSRCIAIDKDENCRKFLEESNLTHSVRFVQGSFAKIVEILTQEKVTSQDVGFILADLGVSSMQLDNASRGFSFSHDGPLDMRMDLSQSTTAWQVVNQSSEEALGNIIRELGEERKWKRVAAAIVKERQRNPINTTCQLANIVCNAKKERARYRKIHPATLTFQSLRLFVNSELNELNTFIPMALSCLGPVGRLAIISFHSLEDRIVKQTFKEYAEKSEFRILTKKPIVPSEEEREVNIRCRSAKMRVIERYPKGNERDFTQH